MFSLTCVEGLKLSTILGGTSIRCPVVGFMKIRSMRFFGSKVPKLIIVTLSPPSKVSDIAEMTALTIFCVFSLFVPVFFDRAAINSLLFKVIYL